MMRHNIKNSVSTVEGRENKYNCMLVYFKALKSWAYGLSGTVYIHR